MSKKTANKTTLPKGYISWQQIHLVEKDPKEYVNVYVYGKKRDFKSMENGKKTHKKLAKGIRPFGMNVPVYPLTNVKIECVLKRKNQELVVIGEIDGLDTARNVVGEYKTDTKMWSATRAKEHGQQKLYALMRYRNTGIIPSAEITCLESQNVLGTIKLTGKHLTHTIKYTLKDMLEMEARVWNAHDKIIKLVEKELSNIF